MKKNILLLFTVFALVFSFSSCEDDVDPIPDINLTPVYSITTGNNSLKTIHVYREKNLLTVTDNVGKVLAYDTENYADTTDDLNYMVAVTALEQVIVATENDAETTVTITKDYVVTADKETGIGTVSITTTNADETTSVVSLSGVKVVEEEVFN